MAGDTKIPTTPTGPASGGGGGGGGGGTSSPGTSSGSGGSGGSGGGGYGSASWYKAQERKANRKANKRLLADAQTLAQQAAVWRKAVDSKFEKALRTKLGNVNRTVKQQDKILREGYRARYDDLLGAAEQNLEAATDAGFNAMSNAARERSNAISEATAMGAGESDVLAATQASLRALSANKSEISRGFADTQQSILASNTDLRSDVKTGRANIFLQANADKEQLYTNYYNQVSEAWTNIGNIEAQRASTLGQANEAIGSKKTRKMQRKAQRASEKAFEESAAATGEAWKNPGVPKRIRKWEGRDIEETSVTSAPIEAVTEADTSRKAPEGATLRSWTA